MASTKLPPRATTNTGATAARIKPKTVGSGKALTKSPFDVNVTMFPKELSKIWQLKNSPGGKLTTREAKRVQAAARSIAPRSPNGSHGRKSGYLASKIGLFIGEDTTSMYVDVVTRAKTPKAKKSGKASYYGRIQNTRLHYLKRAVQASKE